MAAIAESHAALQAELSAYDADDPAMQLLGSARAELAAGRVALEALARRIGAI